MFAASVHGLRAESGIVLMERPDGDRGEACVIGI